jgi:hypothetical protein
MPPAPALPEIEDADLAAVRHFLTSFRDEERRDRAAGRAVGPPLRSSIARMRSRSARKAGA